MAEVLPEPYSGEPLTTHRVVVKADLNGERRPRRHRRSHGLRVMPTVRSAGETFHAQRSDAGEAVDGGDEDG